MEVNPDKKHAILSYHSYQYYIILGLTNNIIRGNARQLLFKECKSYKWLVTYSISNKTKKCALVLKLFGLNLASKIFGYYIKNK